MVNPFITPFTTVRKLQQSQNENSTPTVQLLHHVDTNQTLSEAETYCPTGRSWKTPNPVRSETYCLVLLFASPWLKKKAIVSSSVAHKSDWVLSVSLKDALNRRMEARMIFDSVSGSAEYVVKVFEVDKWWSVRCRPASFWITPQRHNRGLLLPTLARDVWGDENMYQTVEELPVVSLNDLKKHNTRESAWIALKDYASSGVMVILVSVSFPQSLQYNTMVSFTKQLKVCQSFLFSFCLSQALLSPSLMSCKVYYLTQIFWKTHPAVPSFTSSFTSSPN